MWWQHLLGVPMSLERESGARSGPGVRVQTPRAEVRGDGSVLRTRVHTAGRGLWVGSYLVVSPPDVQDVPLGDRPVEGQAWHSVAKGERVLAVGDPGDINGHLQERSQARGNRRSPAEHAPRSPGHCLNYLSTAWVPSYRPCAMGAAPRPSLQRWTQHRCGKGWRNSQ